MGGILEELGGRDAGMHWAEDLGPGVDGVLIVLLLGKASLAWTGLASWLLGGIWRPDATIVFRPAVRSDAGLPRPEEPHERPMASTSEKSSQVSRPLDVSTTREWIRCSSASCDVSFRDPESDMGVCRDPRPERVPCEFEGAVEIVRGQMPRLTTGGP